MAGISSKAAGEMTNKDKTFQGQKFVDDLGLDWIEFKYRNHDPQIGRSMEIDPLSNKYVYNSTYAFSENKVTNNVELEGLEAAPPPGQRNPNAEKYSITTDPYTQIPQTPNKTPAKSPSSKPSLRPSQTGEGTGTAEEKKLFGSTTTITVAKPNVKFDDAWLGKLSITPYAGYKVGEEGVITANTNIVNGNVEGGDIGAGGISIGGKLGDINPTIGITTTGGSEVHMTLPLNVSGLITQGFSLGFSQTDTKGVVKGIDLDYKTGEKPKAVAGLAGAAILAPELIPIFTPIVKKLFLQPSYGY